MKKIIAILICLFLVGCDMADKINNEPIKKVEDYISLYQTNDKEIITELNNRISNYEHKNKIKEIILKNYKKIKYEIVKSTIDGDNAFVEVKIVVVDYRSIDISNYEQIKEAKDKVTYTLNFELNKKNDIWQLINVNNEIIDKINGIY